MADGSVDTLVYQLEDEDPSVRWCTLQRLRKLAAAVEQLPVRNPRRFLHGLRRRLADDDHAIAREALRLVHDVLGVLGDHEVEQVHASILPHLVPRLAAAMVDDHVHTSQDPLDDDCFAVFRRYLHVTNDLDGLVAVLSNLGLAHGRGHVREASLVAIVRLLHERYAASAARRSRARKATSSPRVDAGLFTGLVQAIVPMLEDEDERVVVAAEEAIATIQGYWGDAGFATVMPFLSHEDTTTLAAHRAPIEAFRAATAEPDKTTTSSLSASQVLRLRASLPVFSPHAGGDDSPGLPPPPLPSLRCGFIADDVYETLLNATGNSNAEWKRRTTATEQVYATIKTVSPDVLRRCPASELVELVDDVLVRLLQDLDVHLIKRGLQIGRLLFGKLSPDDEHVAPAAAAAAVRCLERLLPYLIDVAVHVGFNDDDKDELTTDGSGNDPEHRPHVDALFQTLFRPPAATTWAPPVVITRMLLPSLQHRRLQLREAALRIWITGLLTWHEHELDLDDVLSTTKTTIQALGRVLGDGSSRVRTMAREAVAVLAAVTRRDVCGLLESQLDEAVLERIDLEALDARVRRLHRPRGEPRHGSSLPVLLPSGRVVFTNRGDKLIRHQADHGAGAGDNRIQRQQKTSTNKPPHGDWNHSSSGGGRGGVDDSELLLLDGHSEMQQLMPTAQSKDSIRSVSPTRHRLRVFDDEGAPLRGPGPSSHHQRGGSGQQQHADDDEVHEASHPQRTTLTAPSEPVADKLSALKRKAEVLKRSASSRQVIASASTDDNPQDGSDRPSPPLVPLSRHVEPRVHPMTTKIRREEGFVRDRGDYDGIEIADTASTVPSRSRRPPMSSSNKSPVDDPAGAGAASEFAAVVVTSPDDRPIRPMGTKHGPTDMTDAYSTPRLGKEDDEPGDDGIHAGTASSPTKRAAAGMSLATKKRLEARQRKEASDVVVDSDGKGLSGEIDGESEAPPPRKPRAMTKPLAPGALSEKPSVSAKASSSLSSSTEPRYLEPHELTPVPNPKAAAQELLPRLRSDDWEANFGALNSLRRLARHHPEHLAVDRRGLVAAVLAHVPNLRSSVAKNALLAVESLCQALGRQLDADVDGIVAVLMKRCGDSNAFVCESAATTLGAVILHCTTARVVSALVGHLGSRAVPIRREVARGLHAVVVSLADTVLGAKELLGTILSAVGKCLEDSNNEVRDAAKQTILYLHATQSMDAVQLKRLFPASLHTRIDQLLAQGRALPPPQGTNRVIPIARTVGAVEDESTKTTAAKAPIKGIAKASGSSTGENPNKRLGRPPQLDVEALTALIKKLDSGNWSDRFSAIDEAVGFVQAHSTALCETGRLLHLFDSLIKRLEDGNAKVSVQALEAVPRLTSILGNNMEMVLSNLLPALSKALAVTQGKHAALALTALQTLCASVEARMVCQHIAAVARHANTRIKPTLLELLEQLATTTDERTQSALSRYVLPLAIELLKEAKSEVKDANARLLRTLQSTLGHAAVQSATSKLSVQQQERLSQILRGA